MAALHSPAQVEEGSTIHPGLAVGCDRRIPRQNTAKSEDYRRIHPETAIAWNTSSSKASRNSSSPANVYVPTNATPPFPAVIGVAGHSATGKAIDTYQYAWIGMVKRGFLVIAFDPPGQGERSRVLRSSTRQIVRRNRRQRAQYGRSTNPAHRRGVCTLRDLGRYTSIRLPGDAQRCGPKRIAVAGNSGGGTQSAYLAVFEPRLAACVISCYMTNWTKKLWTKPGPLGRGTKFPRFSECRAQFRRLHDCISSEADHHAYWNSRFLPNRRCAGHLR